jgi:NAD(P)-dependent dehydrogenase (short-subunit alcohol dehydrogenase family)
MSYDYTTYFHELTDSRVDQIMSVNVGSTTWMTRIVLQKMLDKARELARSGNKDAARQMLSQLKEMMENLLIVNL